MSAAEDDAPSLPQQQHQKDQPIPAEGRQAEALPQLDVVEAQVEVSEEVVDKSEENQPAAGAAGVTEEEIPAGDSRITAEDVPIEPSPLPEGEPMRVRLPVFEGPLDLLLYLIKKEELDIYDVAIERVTRQYLDYIRAMKEMDLEIAGEFLVVASTLVYIKSRNLLPKDVQPPEDDAEEDDPRWELVRQLVEYKKFKDAAFQLQLRHTAQEKAYERILTAATDAGPAASPAMAMLIGDAGIYDLINAFQKVLARAQSRNQLAEIVEDRWTVSDKIRYIDDLLERRNTMAFEELFAAGASRTEMVVTFLALLELVRLKRLRVLQDYSFAGIVIERRTGVTGPIPSGPSGFEE